MKPEEVIKFYFGDVAVVVAREGQGGINLTYKATIDNGAQEYLLQKMSSIFEPTLMEDLDVITTYLASKNIHTQRVVKTLSGENHIKDGNSWWRIMTYLPGHVFYGLDSSSRAGSAGELVGKFHSALLDLEHNFKFKLPGYHQPYLDIAKFINTVENNKENKKYRELQSLAEDIISNFKKLPTLPDLPDRIIHNDLKISNVLFDESGDKAIALIDLDPIAYDSMAIELGDMLRDWCLIGGEDAKDVKFSKEIYDATLVGYFSSASFLTEEEKVSVPLGVQIMSLSLAARFTTDAFEESYFVLNSTKYANLFEQNKKRAENQLAFFKIFSDNSLEK